MRILLVEDDDLLANGLQTSLQHARYTVNRVDNGKDALLALSVPENDLMILDLGLPDIDGLEVIKIIRQKKLTTPVLIIDSTCDRVLSR